MHLCLCGNVHFQVIQSGWFKWYEKEKDVFKSLDLEHLEELFHREEREEKQVQPAGLYST